MPIFCNTELGTARLRLRRLRDADAPALYAIFSDAAVTRYWSSGPWLNPQQACDSIDASQADYRTGDAFRWAITLAADDEVIGCVSFYDVVAPSQRCAVGYALNSGFQGRGLMREALACALSHAFAAWGLRRIEADVDPRNLRSLTLLAQLGFVLEGLLRERWTVEGEVCHTALLGLLSREWQPAGLAPRA
jgi:ribosomal-protein-alanine N-acetyltransferase